MRFDIRTYNYDDDLPPCHVDIDIYSLVDEIIKEIVGYSCYSYIKPIISEKINEIAGVNYEQDIFKKELGVSKEQLIRILKNVAPEEFI